MGAAIVESHGLSRIERAPAYRLVYEVIEREILAGRLRVGDPLPAELQLAEQLGVNRSTVREGIRLLEQSGLVERNGGKRPRIATPHYLDLASSASRALILHSVTFRELWEASMVLEPSIAERAARNIDDSGLADLGANLATMDTAVAEIDSGAPADVNKFVEIDRAFHENSRQGGRQSRARAGPRTGHFALYPGGPDHFAAAENVSSRARCSSFYL